MKIEGIGFGLRASCALQQDRTQHAYMLRSHLSCQTGCMISDLAGKMSVHIPSLLQRRHISDA